MILNNDDNFECVLTANYKGVVYKCHAILTHEAIEDGIYEDPLEMIIVDLGNSLKSKLKHNGIDLIYNSNDGVY